MEKNEIFDTIIQPIRQHGEASTTRHRGLW